MRAEDPNIPELLKELGYTTGQFGKNHFGDRDEHLPTMHGFDEFFGNLYHLNAEEEPELPDYPDAGEFPDFRKNYGPRGVLHCWSDGKGGQKIDNTGPLTKERMKTIDTEFLKSAKEFIQKAHKDGKPFFLSEGAGAGRVERRQPRGGSFLCNEDYCLSYRPSARRGTEPYNSMSHLGFRLVMDQGEWDRKQAGHCPRGQPDCPSS